MKKKNEYTEKLLITNFLKNCKRDFNKPKIAIANMNAWF